MSEGRQIGGEKLGIEEEEEEVGLEELHDDGDDEVGG